MMNLIRCYWLHPVNLLADTRIYRALSIVCTRLLCLYLVALSTQLLFVGQMRITVRDTIG